MEAVTANMKKENDCYFGMNEDMDYRELILLLKEKEKRIVALLWMSYRQRDAEAQKLGSHLRAAKLRGFIMV